MLEIDVLCVGHANYDLTLGINHQPGPDEKTVASWLVECGGGPAANAALTVARLGSSVAFLGYLGRDIWGERHVQEFIEAGVITDFIVRGDFPTPLSVILVKPDGQRSVVNYSGSTPNLQPDVFDLASLSPKMILFDGHEPELSFALLRQARQRGIPTMLDAGSVHRGTQGLVAGTGDPGGVDYLICSEKFAHDFTGLADEMQAALATDRSLAQCGGHAGRARAGVGQCRRSGAAAGLPGASGGYHRRWRRFPRRFGRLPGSRPALAGKPALCQRGRRNLLHKARGKGRISHTRRSHQTIGAESDSLIAGWHPTI